MNEIIYKSISYCKEENYNKAKKILLENKNLHNWEKYFILSSLNHKSKDKKKLILHSKKILEIIPNSKFANNNLGNIYLSLNLINQAIKYYKKSINKKKDEMDIEQNSKLFFKDISNYNRFNKVEKGNDEIFSKIENSILDIRTKLSLKQIISTGRPHFSELYNKIEILIKDINKILKKIYLLKHHIKNKKNLSLIIEEINQLKLKFNLLSKIKADYENPFFNLAKCFLLKKKYEKAIKFFKLANSFDKTDKYNSRILEVFYLSNKKNNFTNLIKKIKKNKKIDFFSLAVSNFVSEQWNIKNQYIFCNDPLSSIYKNNILNNSNFNPDTLKHIEKEIKKNRNRLNTPVVIGHKSTGNIFDNKTPNILKLKKVINTNIQIYKKKFFRDKNLMIKYFPKKFTLNGWFISLKKGGQVTSHIHDGWLSGVFYLKKPKQKKLSNGDIELTSRYSKLPIIKKPQNKKILKIVPGDLLLFPSSLPHRVIPFNSSKERLSIAFDMKPII